MRNLGVVSLNVGRACGSIGALEFSGTCDRVLLVLLFSEAMVFDLLDATSLTVGVGMPLLTSGVY